MLGKRLNSAKERDSENTSRLLGHYEEAEGQYQVLEKKLATTGEDTQVLIALRTATEGGDRGGRFLSFLRCIFLNSSH